jgi:hypothetical protein
MEFKGTAFTSADTVFDNLSDSRLLKRNSLPQKRIGEFLKIYVTYRAFHEEVNIFIPL